MSAVTILMRLLSDLIGGIGLAFRQRKSLEAELLFLRRQLALYVERGIKPRRIDAVTRLGLVLLSRPRDWRSALVVVRPETLVRWHRAGFRLLWRWKSRAGRPPIPVELRETVRKYLSKPRSGHPRGDQRWSTFLRNRAQAIVACDFFVTVTCSFRLLYVLVVMEHYSRRLIHCNVTAHPSALWTRQQLREALGYETQYQYLIHERDSIFCVELDSSIGSFGLHVVKTAPRCPMANGICERVIGSIRRECLDWLIPFSEAHLRRILKSWIGHYNRGRPHMVLGPGVPDPPATVSRSMPKSHHGLEDFGSVCSKAVLGGLHHEYSLVPA